MKFLKIVGAIIGGLVACVGVFIALCLLVFWREPDPAETCANVARFSSQKAASSELGMKLCIDSMSRDAYGFNNKRKLASYRRCLHGATSAAELNACKNER